MRSNSCSFCVILSLERRELRRHLALDGLHGVVAHRRAVDAVDGGRAARARGRCARAPRSCSRTSAASGLVAMQFDLGEVARHADLEGRLQVASTLTLSNGGTPPYGPVHGATRGSASFDLLPGRLAAAMATVPAARAAARPAVVTTDIRDMWILKATG